RQAWSAPSCWLTHTTPPSYSPRARRRKPTINQQDDVFPRPHGVVVRIQAGRSSGEGSAVQNFRAADLTIQRFGGSHPEAESERPAKGPRQEMTTDGDAMATQS